MIKDALFWVTKDQDKVQCILCPHNCILSKGATGRCGVRINKDGRLYSLIYGACSSVAIDPIEKKPLYHFHPGSSALSFGSVGCNLSCRHCQNYTISTADVNDIPLREIQPEEAVKLAKKSGSSSISWTYNEPTIWYEYTLDTAKIAKSEDVHTTYVTNGYINSEPLKTIAPHLDAMNIDVKAFTERFYREVCKASLRPVLMTCELAKNLGIHIELTYLVIPGYNDSINEIKDFVSWVKDKLGLDTPVHFSRFHPDHKMTDVEATPLETLKRIYETASKELYYVYLGNVPYGDYEHTYCYKCRSLCVERHGFSAEIKGLYDNGTCKKCGSKIHIHL
ncbi:MAG: AmmeMemoRadiSam system radical SAM enzyme [Candidatus Thermoplasmatota archaeon]